MSCNKMSYKDFVNIHMHLFEKELAKYDYEIKPKWFNTDAEYENECQRIATICRENYRRRKEFVKNSKKLYKQYCKGEYEI